MKFGEKIRIQRKNRKLHQAELAKELGLATRTLVNYENGASHPKSRDMYFKLAEFFEVDVNYFLTEDEEFLTAAAKQYGKRGQDRAQVILEQTSALFAGGELSEQDQIAFLHEMQAIFFDSKERAKKKYTPKKYRKPESSNE